MFQDEAPLLRAHAHPAIADTWTAAVNLVVVESDGSRPNRPDYLRGGGLARRHRAACNRGHGLLRGASSSRSRRPPEGQPARALSPGDRGSRKSRRFQIWKWPPERDLHQRRSLACLLEYPRTGIIV